MKLSNYKKIILLAVVLAFNLGLSFALTNSTNAHELLPAEVVEYLKENPDASTEDIQTFVNESAPELADKYEDKDELVAAVRGSTDLGFFSNAWLFIEAGIHHILAGPDHILFVLSLLLVFVSFTHILKLSATFTIAHSITLILGGTAILSLSAKIVEPIIALSIAYVALTSVYFKNSKFSAANKTIPIIFFFGLFHGLGFAGLLEEIQIPSDKFFSSLLFFNIGIEIGQLMIILLVLPAIYFFKDKIWYPTVIKVIGTIFGLMGLFWAIQRIFLTK